MIVTHEKCYVCGDITDFLIADNASLVRDAQCKNCTASIRSSDLSKIVIKKLLNNDSSIFENLDLLKNYHILIAESTGAIHNLLKYLPNYVFFEYFDDIASGEYKYGSVMCNNLEKLTFESNKFDLIITQEVFEHIENTDKAFEEINRVLKIGGSHVFTVPFHELKSTISRKNLRNVHHGDPVREEGALVRTDWGNDICSIIDRFGMKTERFDLHTFFRPDEITNVDESYDKYLTTDALNYYRYNSTVFTSVKTKHINNAS